MLTAKTLLLLFVFFQLRRLQKSFAIFPLSFAGVILGSRLGDKLLHTVSVSSIFVRRMILGPGLITGWYFEFFTANPKVLFTNSPFMKPFVRSFYVLQPSNEIAAAYMGRPETSANGNLFADGYAQLGYAGVILFGLGLALFFWIYDSVAKKRDWRLGALMITVPSLTLSNTAFLTSLVSHGVIMATLVQYFAPASRDELALGRGVSAVEDSGEVVPDDDGVVVS